MVERGAARVDGGLPLLGGDAAELLADSDELRAGALDDFIAHRGLLESRRELVYSETGRWMSDGGTVIATPALSTSIDAGIGE